MDNHRYPWIVGYTCPVTGDRKQKRTKTRLDMQEWIEIDLPQMWEDAAAGVSAPGLTFRQALEAYRNDALRIGIDNRKPIGLAHFKRLESVERNYLANFPLIDERISTADRRECLAFMRSLFELKTENAGLAGRYIRGACSHAIQQMHIVENPFEEFNPPPAKSSKARHHIVIPQREHVRKILDRALERSRATNRTKDKQNWLRMHAMISVAAMAGMRVGEIIALSLDDFNGLEINVRRARKSSTDVIAEPKSRAGIRTIPVPPALVAAVQSYVKAYSTASYANTYVNVPTPIFLTRNGTLPTLRNIGRSLEELCKECGIESFTMHDLRHFYASALCKQNPDMVTLKKRLGHSKVQTTIDIYGHLLHDANADKFMVEI